MYSYGIKLGRNYAYPDFSDDSGGLDNLQVFLILIGTLALVTIPGSDGCISNSGRGYLTHQCY
ncbi:MAG: hypothetical protein KZQ92_21510 [Candidatus Thiodiazotropha sp. (ex Lucinoma borealis)]|nr:hypothetical protein [Candidatus Thiodiazotropha sp. (ex Troendleina suluensis)]MCU7866539.1 hypothetical protein [Candidatus Thiodiazotropha sp. (ex Lucinoma borealis)]